MQIVFTRHAKLRAQQRKIDLVKIIQTIESPDLVSLEDEKNNKFAYYQKYKDHLFLKVVIVKDEDKIIVITIHPVNNKSLSKITTFIESI